MRNNLIEKSLEIATKAHKGQFRKDSKTPYITHPIAVSEKFKNKEVYFNDFYNIDSKILEAIALLHDVIEDSEITLKDLVDRGIPQEVVNIVNILTKRPFENYLGYILNIKTNKVATLVKIEDIKHNLSTSKGHQRDKYILALYILGSEETRL